ncbi:MAG: HPF/RaiA family ribosome-associated protein [Paracoccaceae bacterium]|nr:HPF/RaiA family ribosome-associated protein [Paracoccaceae bacterium]
MQKDPVITWTNLDPAPAVETVIRHRIAALEKFFPNLIGCRVGVDAPGHRHRTAGGVDVRLHVELPGPDLDVARSVRHGHRGPDAVLAVNRAFDAIEGRLRERARVMDAKEVKHHAPVLHGEVVELEPALGYGFLRADDGAEVYFQRDALGDAVWGQLKTGDRLRFRTAEGEKGPFAVDVSRA